MGETPVLLTSPAIRPFVRSLIERFRPSSVVLGQAEVHAKVRLKAMGQV
jgi:flagellar biosynthesis protein FlhA